MKKVVKKISKVVLYSTVESKLEPRIEMHPGPNPGQNPALRSSYFIGIASVNLNVAVLYILLRGLVNYLNISVNSHLLFTHLHLSSNHFST